MCGSIFFRIVGRAMMKKENKKTEPDVKNNDRQKEIKSVKRGSMAPALSAILVVACAGASVAAYTPKVYAVQKAAPKATESDTVEATTAEEMNLEGQVFDLSDGIYEGTGTGFAGKITVAVEIKDIKNIYRYFSLTKTDVPISILVNNGGFIPLASNIISKLGIINTNIKNPDTIDIIIRII